MPTEAVAHEEIIPNARGLIRTFAGHNYTFGESIADLIDNSIDAGATRVQIRMEFDGPRSSVMIADNGKGLPEAEIREALRPGTEREYAADDKGKFGLGLKTASLRHCRNLTLVARRERENHIAARELDVDDIEKSNNWRVKVVPPPRPAIALLGDGPGTVVAWRKIGKLLGFQHAWGKHAVNHFNKLARQLEEHLSMVFHRFLARQASRRRPLDILINGTKLEAWDPFARDEPATVDLGEHSITIAGTRGKGLVVYHPYILPNKAKFSSPRAFERYGRNRWNERQGLYVYRSDRLIQAGGWSRMRTQDEHTKYARASIDFQRDLDDAFELNVSKNWFKLPEDLREKLEPHLEMLFREAKKAYKPDSVAPGVHPASPRKPGPGEPEPEPSTRPGAPSRPEPTGTSRVTARKALEDAAKAADASATMRKIARELVKLHPAVARDLGW